MAQTMLCSVCGETFNWTEMSRANSDMCKGCYAQDRDSTLDVLRQIFGGIKKKDKDEKE